MYEACMDEQGDLSHEPSSKCSSWRWNTGESPSNELKNYGMFKMLWCSSQKNSACWIVHSNQVCGVFYIKRYHRRRSRHNVVQMHGTIREDRTSLINPTWTGHRMVCNLWQGVYYSSPHQRMFRGSFQCKTPSRHDVCLHDEYFTSNRLFNDTRRLFTRIKHIWYLV